MTKKQPIILPTTGSLLVSEPFLSDENFKRTVVMLCEHNEEGSFGFVVNRPSETFVHDAIENFPYFEAPLYIGGPVENNTLHYIHRLGERLPESVPLMDGLWWGGNFEVLVILIQQNQISPDDIRLFAGYSGWGAGQLQEELDEDSWIVTMGKPDYLFETSPDQLWQHVLKDMGGRFQMMANFPESPLLN